MTTKCCIQIYNLDSKNLCVGACLHTPTYLLSIHVCVCLCTLLFSRKENHSIRNKTHPRSIGPEAKSAK